MAAGRLWMSSGWARSQLLLANYDVADWRIGFAVGIRYYACPLRVVVSLVKPVALGVINRAVTWRGDFGPYPTGAAWTNLARNLEGEEVRCRGLPPFGCGNG